MDLHCFGVDQRLNSANAARNALGEEEAETVEGNTALEAARKALQPVMHLDIREFVSQSLNSSGSCWRGR